MYTEQMSQGLSIVDKIDPASVNAANATSNGMDMSKFRRAMYEVQVGSFTGAATVSAVLQTCANSNFASNVHNMTGGTITTLNNASNNVRVTLETTDEAIVNQNSGDRYLRCVIVVGVNAVVVGATGWGGESKEKPANANDIAPVSNANGVMQRLVVS
jgi:hypothetical protein